MVHEHYAPFDTLLASVYYNPIINLMYLLSIYINEINLVTFYLAYWGCVAPISGCFTDTYFNTHKIIASVAAIPRL